MNVVSFTNDSNTAVFEDAMFLCYVAHKTKTTLYHLNTGFLLSHPCINHFEIDLYKEKNFKINCLIRLLVWKVGFAWFCK